MKNKLINITEIIIFIFFIVGLLFTHVLLVEYFGPHLNDNYAEQQLNEMRNISLPTHVRIVDSSNYIGLTNAGDKFSIWIGIAVETELSLSELNESIQNINGFENILITAYNQEFVSQHNFTGVEKEITDEFNYYILGKTIKPITSFDKRNRYWN